jgi:microcystin-dependent protein
MDPFVAEIRLFPFNFAPQGWAFCIGQVMPISQNTALFSLLGTTYGGDGKSNFGLPDMKASSPMQQGQGGGLSQRFLGEKGGMETVTLLESEIPVHTHIMNAAPEPAELKTPTNQALAGSTQGNVYSDSTQKPNVQTNLTTLSIVGNSLPHNNMMPYLTVNFCIALQGVYPQRP